MTVQHVARPGSYDRVLTCLAGNAGATVNDIGRALGLTRGRVLLVLRAARLNGDVQGVPFSGGQLYPVRWSVTKQWQAPPCPAEHWEPGDLRHVSYGCALKSGHPGQHRDDKGREWGLLPENQP